MSNIKSTIRIADVRSESSFYEDGESGYTVWATCENLTNKSVDIEVRDFYLVQDLERTYDNLYTGYLSKKGTLLPFSKKTMGRIWNSGSLEMNTLHSGNYIIMEIHDTTNGKTYFYRFDYNGLEWQIKYSEVRLTEE